MNADARPEQPRQPDGTLGPIPPWPCLDCGRLTLSRHSRNRLPPAERSNYLLRHGHGRCMTCYRRHVGETTGHDGTWQRGDLYGEWEHLRGYGYDRKTAAAKLRVSYSALCKAIERTERQAAA